MAAVAGDRRVILIQRHERGSWTAPAGLAALCHQNAGGADSDALAVDAPSKAAQFVK